MTSARRRLYVAVAAALTLLAAAPAEAQLIRTRPFRGIFRTTQDPAESKDRLDVVAFLSGGHDELGTRVGDFDVPLDPRVKSASFGSLFLLGTYAHQGRRTNFSASTRASTRYYSATQNISPMYLSGSVRFNGSVGRHGTFNLSQGASYSPYYTFSLAPESLVELDEDPTATFDPLTDLRATRLSTSAYNSAATYGHRVGRRSRLQLGYAFNYVDASAAPADLFSHRPSIRYSRSIGRDMGFHLGYGLRYAGYRDSLFDPLVGHDFDTGFSYDRPLRSWRRTRVGFSVGSGLFVQADQNRFRIGGTAYLAHQFARTWVGTVAYRRGTDVLDGLVSPVFSFTDSLSASVGGRVGGPVHLAAGGYYSHGSFAFRSVNNSVDSGSATLRVSIPVISVLSTYVEGYYAQYQFERRTGLLPVVPAAIERYGVRAGLTVFVPVVR